VINSSLFFGFTVKSRGSARLRLRGHSRYVPPLFTELHVWHVECAFSEPCKTLQRAPAVARDTGRTRNFTVPEEFFCRTPISAPLQISIKMNLIRSSHATSAVTSITLFTLRRCSTYCDWPGCMALQATCMAAVVAVAHCCCRLQQAETVTNCRA